MGTSYALGAIIGPTLLVLGLSMFLQERAWMHRVNALAHEDAERVMFSLIELAAGLAIIYRHNLWELSPWLIITLLGWTMALEGLFHLLMPAPVVKKILTRWNQAPYYKVGGGVMVLLGAWVSYLVYFV